MVKGNFLVGSIRAFNDDSRFASIFVRCKLFDPRLLFSSLRTKHGWRVSHFKEILLINLEKNVHQTCGAFTTPFAACHVYTLENWRFPFNQKLDINVAIWACYHKYLPISSSLAFETPMHLAPSLFCHSHKTFWHNQSLSALDDEHSTNKLATLKFLTLSIGLHFLEWAKFMAKGKPFVNQRLQIITLQILYISSKLEPCWKLEPNKPNRVRFKQCRVWDLERPRQARFFCSLSPLSSWMDPCFLIHLKRLLLAGFIDPLSFERVSNRKVSGMAAFIYDNGRQRSMSLVHIGNAFWGPMCTTNHRIHCSSQGPISLPTRYCMDNNQTALWTTLFWFEDEGLRWINFGW